VTLVCYRRRRRGFLPEEDLPWTRSVRHELQDLYLRSLEAYTAAALSLGATELVTAETSGPGVDNRGAIPGIRISTAHAGANRSRQLR